MKEIGSKTELNRLAIGLTLLSVAGSWALSAGGAVLLPQKIGNVVGETAKVSTLAWVATLANICGFVIAVFAGHLSDRTRSRIGKRNPWIVGSGIGAFFSFLVLMGANSTLMLALSSALIFICITINKAITSAIIPDRVPVAKRGTLSSAIAVGSLIGMAIGLALGGKFVTDVNTGLLITGTAPLVLSVLFVLFVREKSNKEEPHQNNSTVIRQSFLPSKNAPDFYWAVVSRFILVFGTQMILAYQLYIITDHLQQQGEGIAKALSWAATTYTTGAILGGMIGGPLSDKFGKRKGLTQLAIFIIGSSILLMVFFPTVTSFTLYKFFNGLGYGVYLAVHTALVSEVIPDDNSKGRNMSFLNVANGLGGVFAPMVSAFAIGLGMGYNLLFLIAATLSIGSLFLILPIKAVK